MSFPQKAFLIIFLLFLLVVAVFGAIYISRNDKNPISDDAKNNSQVETELTPLQKNENLVSEMQKVSDQIQASSTLKKELDDKNNQLIEQMKKSSQPEEDQTKQRELEEKNRRLLELMK